MILMKTHYTPSRLLLICWFLLLFFTIKASAFHPYTVPVPMQVDKIKNPVFSLNGNWLFCTQPEDEFEKRPVRKGIKGWGELPVPSEWYMCSYEVPKDAWAGYSKSFGIPKDWNGKRVLLRFGAVNTECKVYVNGQYAGYHLGAMTQFSFDITPFVSTGKNDIALYVRSESAAESLSKISRYAKHQVGGIIRGVELIALPREYLSTLSCEALLSDHLNKGTVVVNYAVSQLKEGMELEVVLKGRGIEGLYTDGQEYVRKRIKIASLQDTICFNIDNPKLWHAESPHLYVLEATLLKSGIQQEITEKNIGFRKIEIKGNVLFVNEMPVKLRGIARHDITPYEGRAIVDTALLRRDIELFRNANCNYIRTAHYPPDSYLLDLCDRYGFFVEDEAPACWSFERNTSEMAELQLYCFRAMLERDRSHPSILMWSIANESKWAPEFNDCLEYARKVTPSIPVKFSHSGYFGLIKEVDFESRHYPGWQGLQKYENHFRPVIFDEALHLNAYNTSELATDPALRDLWGDYAKFFVDGMQQAPAITGLGIWSAIDEMFYPHGKEPVGYGPWGIVDGFRRPKPEYWHTKMAFSPIQVTSNTFESREGKTAIRIENRYNTLNIASLDIRWKDGMHTGIAQVNLLPGKEGSLLLNHEMTGDTLSLEFRDKRGFTVFACNLPRNHSSYRLLPSMQSGKSVEVSREKHASVISAGQIRYIYPDSTGMPVALNNGDTILHEVCLYVIPLLASNEAIDYIPQENSKKKVCFASDPLTDWKKDSLVMTQTDSLVIIDVWGRFSDVPAHFTYTINGEGRFKVDYSVNLKTIKEEFRQIGIGFNLPRQYNSLSWQRNALWSVYPADHIGRPVGNCRAFYPEVEKEYLSKRMLPLHSYAQEGNEYGSNDFRSTKHNLINGCLSDDRGANIRIESNGLQHLRAWVNGSYTSFLLANYSNGGNEHYLSFDSDRTKYTSELRMDGNEVAGWIQIRIGW